jgi:hypothetical protein
MPSTRELEVNRIPFPKSINPRVCPRESSNKIPSFHLQNHRTLSKKTGDDLSALSFTSHWKSVTDNHCKCLALFHSSGVTFHSNSQSQLRPDSVPKWRFWPSQGFDPERNESLIKDLRVLLEDRSQVSVEIRAASGDFLGRILQTAFSSGINSFLVRL